MTPLDQIRACVARAATAHLALGQRDRHLRAVVLRVRYKAALEEIAETLGLSFPDDDVTDRAVWNKCQRCDTKLDHPDAVTCPRCAAETVGEERDQELREARA